MFHTGVSVAALLVALGVGYIIRLKAEEVKGGLRTLGVVISYIIIIVSILAGACQLYLTHYKVVGGKAISCPMPHVMMQEPMKK